MAHRVDNPQESPAAPGQAAQKRLPPRFAVRTEVADKPMSNQDFEFAEELLAEFVARTYAADHPELFGTQEGENTGGGGSQPDSA